MSLIAIVVTLLLSNRAHAEFTDTKEIPQKEIWAYEMPGTKNLQDLDSESKRVSGKALLDPISVSFVLRAEAKKWANLARPGFAVQGTGLTALVATEAVFVENIKPKSTFRSTEDVTLVFFSEPIGGTRVRISNILREKLTVRIQYELDQIVGGAGAFNLALVPIGKLVAGKYRVEISQVTAGNRSEDIRYKPMSLSPEWSQEYQCQPFEFRVSETGT